MSQHGNSNAATVDVSDGGSGFAVLAAVFAVACAAILLELSYTRIFSFKLYYFFTYFIIGVAMLGLGSGGVLAATVGRIREADPSIAMFWLALFASISVPFGYAVVTLIQVNTVDLSIDPRHAIALGVICTSLFAPFVSVGMALAITFAARPSEMGRLYFSDLIGAGVGCLVCVPLFASLSPVATLFIAAALLAAAALAVGGAVGRRARAAAMMTLLVMSVLTVAAGALPDPVVDRSKTLSPQRAGAQEPLFSRWSGVFRIDIVPGRDGEDGDIHLLVHDGLIGSALRRFDGDLRSLSHFDTQIRSLPFGVIPKRPSVLIIGAAGGQEILASLYFGASTIDAVELNPVTVALLRGLYADFTGRIAFADTVNLVTGEGRAFLERSQKEYDLIWFVAPDSYAAMNAASSGAYVLSESYLFTTDMITKSLSHLTERGVICVTWGELNPAHNRAVRYIATAREAYRRLGIDGFPRNVLVSTAAEFMSMSTIVLRSTAFDEAEMAAFQRRAAAIPGGRVWQPPTSDLSDHPLRKVLALDDDELTAWLDGYEYNVSPISDDSPFFWHFTRFRHAFERPWRLYGDIPGWELATGERTLLTLLAFVVVFSAIFMFVPLLAVRDVWRSIPGKTFAGCYFACIGLGFMFFEIPLIQRLVLFLGYPTYSLSVTLFGLLTFSGLGSLGSERIVGRYGRDASLAGLLAVVVVCALFYWLGLARLIAVLMAQPFLVRCTVSIAVLAPLGLALGCFMPIGIGTIARTTRFSREYVAWAWAVNGYFSVVASVLATVLAMTLGFSTVMTLGVGLYVAAVFSMRMFSRSVAR